MMRRYEERVAIRVGKDQKRWIGCVKDELARKRVTTEWTTHGEVWIRGRKPVALPSNKLE